MSCRVRCKRRYVNRLVWIYSQYMKMRGAKRRAWPAVSRKDAERMAWTEFVDGLGLPGRGDTP